MLPGSSARPPERHPAARRRPRTRMSEKAHHRTRLWRNAMAARRLVPYALAGAPFTVAFAVTGSL